MVFFQFFHHIIAQCFGCYVFISGSNYIVLVIVFGATLEVLLYCYYGQRLANAVSLNNYFFGIFNYFDNLKGSSVADGIFCSNWYEMTIPEQKILMVMLQKSQEPIYISAGGFFNISLETFVYIIKTGFSFFTFLYSFE